MDLGSLSPRLRAPTVVMLGMMLAAPMHGFAQDAEDPATPPAAEGPPSAPPADVSEAPAAGDPSSSATVELSEAPAPVIAREAAHDPAPEEPGGGSPFDAESYIALSADQDAQESLGGFRRYLERTRESDTDLYRVLDRRLDDLESQEFAADAIFWTATGLGAASLIAAIPVHETLGLDPAIGFMVAGGSVFLLGVLIQAAVRPGRSDLVELIDLHDERLGRR